MIISSFLYYNGDRSRVVVDDHSTPKSIIRYVKFTFFTVLRNPQSGGVIISRTNVTHKKLVSVTISSQKSIKHRDNTNFFTRI
jgi:hypothetical protein